MEVVRVEAREYRLRSASFQILDEGFEHLHGPLKPSAARFEMRVLRSPISPHRKSPVDAVESLKLVGCLSVG
jgi:hypothetical protein